MKLARRLALAVSVAVLLLAALELAARVAVARLPRFAALAANDWYVATPDTGWERRPFYEGKVFGTWREFGADGVLAEDLRELARSAKRPRVVLLGDSCTFGHRVAVEDTFAELLERELGGPDVVDVVNLGVPGYSSYQALRLCEKLALDLDPSIVVFATNFNDRRYVRRAEDARFAWEESAASARAPLARLVRASRLVGLVRELAGADDQEEARSVPGLARQDLHPRVSPERYREHLELFARAVRAHGAKPVFLLLGDAPAETRELTRGFALLERGEAQEAASVFSAVEEERGTFALLARSARARALESLGRAEEARALDALESFIPSLHGGLPLEPDFAYHAVLRAVASAQDAELVDGAAALEPGDYFDFCHFGPSGHRRLANLLALALRPLL